MSRLTDFAETLNNEIECMKNRAKADCNLLTGKISTIIDFDWLTDSKSNEKYPVFIIKEDKEHYFFGGKALSNALHTIEDSGLKDDLKEEGLKVTMEKIKTKNKNDFMKVTFNPLPFNPLPF